MRRKLNKCYQGDNKTITEYAYELQELFNIFRAIADHEKVIKFWYGVQPIIQKGLWRDNLNPDVSTWEEVVSRAEVIEIAENITDHRDQGPGNGPQQHTLVSRVGSHSQGRTDHHNRSSSQSVMLNQPVQGTIHLKRVIKAVIARMAMTYKRE